MGDSRVIESAASSTGLADRTAIAQVTGAGDPVCGEQIHFLVRQQDGGAPLRIELGGQPVTLGRSAAADVVLTDSQVSKRHCEVRVVGREVLVADLGSTNGTLIEKARLRGETVLPVGARLRVGGSVFLHELRFRHEVAQARELENDLRRARAYVEALLPPPATAGPVRTDWCFVPSSMLGGDAFGYHPLGEARFALYLLDVCGHGAGAALHSVAALNALRQHALPGVDFARPEEVLRGLNDAFDMARHGGMYFTAWYGVYDPRTRRLAYASGGHPPALLVGPERREAVALQTRGLPVGTFPGLAFPAATADVAPGSRLYLFSDGVYEIVTREGRDWSLAAFQELVLQPPQPGLAESARLRQAVGAVAGTPELPDDFSLLVAAFD